MNFDATDAMEDRWMANVKARSRAIISFLKPLKQATVGAIRREMPMRDRYIWSALKALKMVGEIDFNEYSCAPTLVYCRSMRRIKTHKSSYGRTAILPPKQKQPYAEHLYGADYKGHG